MFKVLFFFIFGCGAIIKGFGNQEISIDDLKNSWHHVLQENLRHFSSSKLIDTYEVHPNIRVYEPLDYNRSVIWIPGTAFIFEEPNSHDEFLRAFAEKTKSKVFAISHRKIPEISYQELGQEVLEAVNVLSDQNYFSAQLPIMLAGDSSGSFIIKDLLSKILSKILVDQLFFIAPAFDMKCFLEGAPVLGEFPKEAHDEIRNQSALLKFLASLLYPNYFPREESEKLDWIEWFRNIPNLPKIHMVCFEYDAFFPQALQLKASIFNTTIEIQEQKAHTHYLLRDKDSPLVNDDFVFSLDFFH